MRLLLPPALLLAAACAPSGTPNCGIAHMAGATMVLDQFGTPNQTLSSVPPSLPERLVARLAAGPAYPAIVGRVDSLLAIGVEGALPPNVELGYGVLLLDPEGTARGVMLFEGDPIGGAPVLGTVTMGTAAKPLLGLQLPTARYEDAACPAFPDSILR
ncbi:MAG TPA: hypothetical protein VLA95_00425 [Gemmatimonadales bacterium]|nr:hypothetical protein [Gemmatimonadales bacterium]